MPIGLLQGCSLEAERADRVAMGLDGLRAALSESYHAHIVAVTEEIRQCGRLLRDLLTRTQMHVQRVPLTLNYLQIILPCLSRSLRDITNFYEDKAYSRELRWRKMYHEMSKEASGLSLYQRFMLYNTFLSMLLQLLTRDPTFDDNQLEALRNRILDLREKRGIPAPTPVPVTALVRQETMMIPSTHQDKNLHWAEQIFSLPLPSRTALKNPKQSRAYGPFIPEGNNVIPPDRKILFRRSFDNDSLSLSVFINPSNDAPYALLRTYNAGNRWYCLKGIHELRVLRDGSSLQLKRWSHRDNHSKLWALLYFLTWEEMVLFNCSFVALKARNTLTVQIHPDEYKLSKEKRLFQAQIIDDGYQHSLIVYEDIQTHGLRLHAAVWEGELRQCPVWTAFVTHQAASASWLVRRSRHRIWLKDIKLYVFCQKYREDNMRQNKAGAFEIYFVSDEASQRFKEVFYPSISSPEASEAN